MSIILASEIYEHVFFFKFDLKRLVIEIVLKTKFDFLYSSRKLGFFMY
jgi:hypothetical protein